jgi:hypothetical protein
MSSVESADVTSALPATKRYYSTLPFDDGFGAQYQRFIWTCIYAEEYEDSVFVYRTPDKMAHNYDNDPLFMDKMETMMNMKPNYMNYNDAITSGHSILTPNFYDIFNYVERNMDECMKSKSMARIKTHFWANKRRQDIFSGLPSTSTDGRTVLHLAAHIRRPNIDDTKANGGEEYDNDYYIRSLLTIREKYAKKKPNHIITFHIYSQGAADRFTSFVCHPILGPDVILHLNETNEQTYLGMAGADILITSASSFSYSAAFLSDGDIYYTEFWHKPCSWWNVLDK